MRKGLQEEFPNDRQNWANRKRGGIIFLTLSGLRKSLSLLHSFEASITIAVRLAAWPIRGQGFGSLKRGLNVAKEAEQGD